MHHSLFEVRRYRDNVITHSHDHHQIVLPLTGELTMVIGGRRGRVCDSSLAMVAAGIEHSFEGSVGNEFLVLDLAADAAGVAEFPGLWQEAPRHPFCAVGPDLALLIRYLAKASENGQMRDRLADHGAALLLGALAGALGLDSKSGWPASLRSIAGYIDSHLEWPLDVADMARVGNLSPSRLHAQFRQHLDTTPMQFLTERRVHRAMELLEHTALPVSEIALRIGYGDQAAFTRAFRRKAGEAPTAYRARAADRERAHKPQ